MMFPKKKRVVNKELLAEYRKMACVICGKTNEVSAHHMKTRGSGGGDVVSNLVPLCVFDHTKMHQLGEFSMRLKYPQLDEYLKKLGEE